MGEREVAECVEEMIRSVEPGEYPGVLVRERMRDDVHTLVLASAGGVYADIRASRGAPRRCCCTLQCRIL